MNIRDTAEFKSGKYHIVTCPICKKETLDFYWICQHCGWEYDGTLLYEGYSSANKMTVGEYLDQYYKNS